MRWRPLKKPRKILVFDDEPHICKVVKLILEKEGFEVETAQTWPECSDKLEKEKPDLILLDILMPMISGISVLQSIMKSHPQTKVIILTAVHNDFHKEICKEFGAVDYITKPFDNRDLVRRVKNVMMIESDSSNFKSG